MSAPLYPQPHAPLPPPLPPAHAPFPHDPPPAPGHALQGHRGGLTAGGILWSLLGCAAVVYLAVVFVRPDLIPRAATAGSGPVLAEQVDALRGDIATLRREMGEIRSDLRETGAEQRVLAERIAALGTPGAAQVSDPGLPPAALRLDSAPVINPAGPRAAADGPAALPKTTARKAADAKLLNAQPPQPAIETGSVKPPPATAPAPATPVAAAEPPPFGPAVVKPAAGPVAVQIATGASVDSLRLSWNLLSETHADSLKNLEPRYNMSVDSSGLVYNLMAGPVNSEAEAKKMCKALAAKAVPCKIVGEFGGAAL